MNFNIFRKYESRLFLIIFIFILNIFIGVQIVRSFSEPSQAPPENNVPAPINVSGTAQTKAGDLTVSNMLASGFSFPAGTEGNITNVNEIIGFNDLILRGITGNNAPIYIEGNPVVINNDFGTGNVGIGIAIPLQKLHVVGNIRADGFCIGTGACITSWPSGGGLSEGGTINFLSKFTASGTLGNSQIFDDGTSVGIGIAIPGGKLHVVGQSRISGSSLARLTIEPEGGTTNLWNLDNQAGALRIFREDYAASGNGANGAVRMTILNGGNVGIGTESPGSTLTIRRSTAGKAFAIRNTADTADTFTIDDTGTITSGFFPWAQLTSFPATCPPGQFVNAVGGTLTCATPGTGGGTLGGSGTTNFVSKFTAASTLGNSSIFDNGFVGIGTAIPEIKLHVRGGATWGSGLDLDARDVTGGRQWRLASTGGDAGQGQGKFVLYDQTAGQNRLVVDTSGNVGIGTTNTIVNFEVFKSSGTAGPIVRINNDSTGYAYTDFINSNGLLRIGKENSSGGALLTGSVANAGILATQGANPLQFGTNDAVAVTILSGGNVGIGTTNPSDKLQVSGGNIRLDNGYELYFADNGQIRSSDNNHRILFRRSENKLELREYGDIVFSPGSTSGQETAKVVFKSDGNVCLSGICKSQWPSSGGLNPWYFIVGGNGALYYKVGVGGSWSEVPGGCCVSTVGLSAARDYSDSIHVVARGGDGQAYRKIFYKSGLWSGWDLVAGGSFPGVPAVETRD